MTSHSVITGGFFFVGMFFEMLLSVVEQSPTRSLRFGNGKSQMWEVILPRELAQGQLALGAFMETKLLVAEGLQKVSRSNSN